MKFTSLFSFTLTLIAATFAAPSPAATKTLAYDVVYDKGTNSLNIVACSNGENGLVTQGYTTFNSLPGWPNVGAVDVVTGWNDPDCGSCWNVTYTNSKGVSRSAYITAIDVSTSGFVVGKNVMNTLTGGNAVQLGRVNVQSSRVADSYCGF